MRIGVDIRNVGKNRTGDETVFENIARFLARDFPDDSFRFYTDRDDREFIESLEKKLELKDRKNAQIVPVCAADKFRWNAYAIAREVRKNPVDIFHTQYITPLFIPRSVKIVSHIHDVSFSVFPKLISPKDRFFLRTLMLRSIRRADILIAPSQFTKDEIIRVYGASKEKIAVVSNAVSEDFVRAGSADYETRVREIFRVRGKYNLPEKYVLSVSTLQPRKNIPFLVRVFAHVVQRASEYSLVICGSKSAHHYDSEIDRVISEEEIGEKVIFPGYVAAEDLPWVFAGADVFANFSLYEGFGVPLLEAFSVGTPVVASDIAPFREVSGGAAVLCGVQDLEKIADVMYDLSTDEELRARCASNGMRRLALFSWEKSAKDLYRAYRSLLERKNGYETNV